MKLTKEIYLNCGVYNNIKWDPSEGCYEDHYMLFIAVPGYFASSAWCESDEAYQGISGRKFEGITADDGKSWSLDRQYIRRLDETDNIDRLLLNACESFRTMFNERFIKSTNIGMII